MFKTEGPLDPKSPLFAGRVAEIKKLTEWVESVHCVGAVSGARQTGKTSLLLQMQEQSNKDKYGFVFIDLEAIYNATSKDCYIFVCQEMLTQLFPNGYEIEPADDGASFMKFLREISGKMSVVRVVVMLDEIGALLDETSTALAHTLRAVLTNRYTQPEYANFVFILSGSSDMKRITTDKVSPLRNVIDSIYIPDLSAEEADYVLCKGFESQKIDMPKEVRNSVFEWTNGHPYLTQLMGKHLVEYCQATGATPNEQAVGEIAESLLQTEDKNLPYMRRLLNDRSPYLWPLVVRIMEGKLVRFSRSNDHLADLELMGVIGVQDGYCSIRNRIYERALRLWCEERKSDGSQSAGSRLLKYLAGFMGGLSASQKLLLLAMVLTLIVDALMNWTQPPPWLTNRPWLFAALLGSAIVVFVVISIIQEREQQLPPLNAHNEERSIDSQAKNQEE